MANRILLFLFKCATGIGNDIETRLIERDTVRMNRTLAGVSLTKTLIFDL